jgi:two-component system sensor histidine kinase/response regulator
MNPANQSSPARRFALGFLVLAAGISAAGWFYYKQQQAEVRRAAQETLATIADLKVQQLVQWRAERLADANYLRSTSYAARRALDVLSQPDSGTTRQMFTAWLDSILADGQFEQVLLLDKRLNVGLVYPDHAFGGLHDAERSAAAEALSSRHVVVADLHRKTGGSPVYLSFMVPFVVRREGANDNVPAAGKGESPADRGAGVMVLQINARRFLYPLVQNWPTRSRTAETLLIRREGNEVVYLNELRHRTNTALALRFRLDPKLRLPAVMAVQGQEGVVEGVDYRGIPVLAALRKIPDTPWFMVAKVDQEEIYAPLRRQAWTIGLITCLLLLIVALGVTLLWRQQELAFSRRELTERQQAEATLRESEERFRTVVETAPDAIFIQTKGRFAYVNAAALRLFSAAHPEDLLGQPVLDRFHPDFHALVGERIRLLNEDRRPVDSVDEVCLTLAGSSKDVNVSAVPFTYLNQNGALVFARDITERKRAETKLSEQLDELRRWHEVMLGREMRALELKRQVNDLHRRLGEPIRYSSQAEAGDNQPPTT